MASIKEIKTTDVNIILDKVKWYHSIYVASVTLDGDVTCLHCGKNLKSGKTVTIADDYFVTCVQDGWGSYRQTFCSSSHARIFNKNKKNL
jgi:hypothetical protein